jgi:hypothetical protein
VEEEIGRRRRVAAGGGVDQEMSKQNSSFFREYARSISFH